MCKKVFSLFVLGMTLFTWADETQQVQANDENQIQAIKQDSATNTNSLDTEFIGQSNPFNENTTVSNQQTETTQDVDNESPIVANNILIQKNKKRKKYDLLSAYEEPLSSKEDFDKAREFVKREKERMRMIQPIFFTLPINSQTN